MENDPSFAVRPPIVVPSTLTVAPLRGSLDFLSVILPEIMVCAMAMMPEQENMNARRRAYGMRI
jgi:hypothetical protein